MFNQSKVVPTVLSTTPKMYIYPTKSQKSPLFTFQPILWRHSRFFPYLAEIGLEPRVKRHMMNVLSPDRKQSKVYAAAASYKTHRYVCIYNCIYNCIYIYSSCCYFGESVDFYTFNALVKNCGIYHCTHPRNPENLCPASTI